MNLNTGEAVPWNAEFACVECHARVLINAGQALPRCPECWGQVFRKARELAGRMIFAPDIPRTPDQSPYRHDLRAR